MFEPVRSSRIRQGKNRIRNAGFDCIAEDRLVHLHSPDFRGRNPRRNFDYLPDLHFRYSYYLMWAAMIGVAVGMLGHFKKRKWL